MIDKSVTFHYIASGYVQGVGFRWFTKQLADKLGVLGTVENLNNGDVEIFATGSPEIMQMFEEKLRIGPSFGSVRELRSLKVGHKKYTSFSILLEHYR